MPTQGQVPLSKLALSVRRPRIFYGWWVVAAGAGSQALTSALAGQGFGLYFVALQKEFGWSRTLLAGAFSFTRLEGAVIGPVEGFLVDRLGPRRVMLVGFAVCGLGFLLFSFTRSPLTFYLSFLVISFGTSLAGYIPVTAAANNWFIRKRALAMAVAQSGASLGGLLVPVLALSLAAAGWRQTAVGAAALVFVGGVLLASRMRTRPEDYGLLPDGETRPDGPQDSTAVPRRPAAAMARDFTAAEALRTRAFWLLSIAHSFSIVALTAATVHQIPYMVSGLGMSTQAAAAVVALFTGVQLVAQLGCGLVGDRINKRYAIAALTLGQGVALAVLGLLHSLAGPLLFAVLLGACWGARMPLILAIRGDYFGRKSYATIAGWLNATLAAGSMVGPVLAGVLADRLGTYNPVFLILSVLPAVGAGLFFLAKAPVPGTASVQTSALP